MTDGAPTPLLFLVADNGGGHRAPAQAVAEALQAAYPGRFAPVLFDPLTGPRSARLRVAGGGEGCGGIARRAATIVDHLAGIQVVAVCGRNRRARHTLSALAAGTAGRLTVTGFTRNLADWLRCADLVVTKAGPGTIAEAACCGTPMLLTSHLPGQERGNIEFATAAGAARPARGLRDLVREIALLHRDPEARAAMRAGCAALARRAAAADVAELIAGLAQAGSPEAGGPAPAQVRAMVQITSATATAARRVDSRGEPATLRRS